MLRQRFACSCIQPLLLILLGSSVFNLVTLATETAAAAMDQNIPSCPGSAGRFSIAGSASVNRLVRAWAEAYPCPTEITVEDATSSTGAARVCGVRRDAAVVDVSSMTRPMNQLEAKTTDRWRFDCEMSTRSTVQVREYCFNFIFLSRSRTHYAEFVLFLSITLLASTSYFRLPLVSKELPSPPQALVLPLIALRSWVVCRSNNCVGCSAT
jgi:hypothetical protein